MKNVLNFTNSFIKQANIGEGLLSLNPTTSNGMLYKVNALKHIKENAITLQLIVGLVHEANAKHNEDPSVMEFSNNLSKIVSERQFAVALGFLHDSLLESEDAIHMSVVSGIEECINEGEDKIGASILGGTLSGFKNYFPDLKRIEETVVAENIQNHKSIETSDVSIFSPMSYTQTIGENTIVRVANEVFAINENSIIQTQAPNQTFVRLSEVAKEIQLKDGVAIVETALGQIFVEKNQLGKVVEGEKQVVETADLINEFTSAVANYKVNKSEITKLDNLVAVSNQHENFKVLENFKVIKNNLTKEIALIAENNGKIYGAILESTRTFKQFAEYGSITEAVAFVYNTINVDASKVFESELADEKDAKETKEKAEKELDEQYDELEKKKKTVEEKLCNVEEGSQAYEKYIDVVALITEAMVEVKKKRKKLADGFSVEEGYSKTIKGHKITWNSKEQRYIIKKGSKRIYDTEYEQDAENWIEDNVSESDKKLVPNTMMELWFAVHEKETSKYKSIADKLDSQGVKMSVQNEVSASAEKMRSKKAIDTSEVADIIKKIIKKNDVVVESSDERYVIKKGSKNIDKFDIQDFPYKEKGLRGTSFHEKKLMLNRILKVSNRSYSVFNTKEEAENYVKWAIEDVSKDDRYDNDTDRYKVIKAIKNLKIVTECKNIKESSVDYTWYIEKFDEDGGDNIEKTYTKFDKNTITKDFDKIAKSLKEDEEVHLMKVGTDKKRVGDDYLFSVVNNDGSLQIEITKGSKTFYKKYKEPNITESKKEGDQKEYQKFIKDKLKSMGKDSLNDLSDDETKKFFSEVDKEWKADDETNESKNNIVVSKVINRKGELSGLKVDLNGDIHYLAYSSDTGINPNVSPYGMTLANDDESYIFFGSKGKDGKTIDKVWKKIEKAVTDFIIDNDINESEIKMNNLDWGKTTEERNSNLEKFKNLKTDKEKEDFKKKLKGSNTNESKKSFDLFTYVVNYLWKGGLSDENEEKLKKACDKVSIKDGVVKNDKNLENLASELSTTSKDLAKTLNNRLKKESNTNESKFQVVRDEDLLFISNGKEVVAVDKNNKKVPTISISDFDKRQKKVGTNTVVNGKSFDDVLKMYESVEDPKQKRTDETFLEYTERLKVIFEAEEEDEENEDDIEDVKEGKKRYNIKNGVGSAKYTVNFHDGVKTHKDGSDFFDIKISKNKKEVSDFVKDLENKGYVLESVDVEDDDEEKVTEGKKFKEGVVIKYKETKDGDGDKFTPVIKYRESSKDFSANFGTHTEYAKSLADLKDEMDGAGFKVDKVVQESVNESKETESKFNVGDKVYYKPHITGMSKKPLTIERKRWYKEDPIFNEKTEYMWWYSFKGMSLSAREHELTTDKKDLKRVSESIDSVFEELTSINTINDLNESFIPNVGTIDRGSLKNLLIKNSDVKSLLSSEQMEFLKSDSVDIIGQSGKPFNSIVTDGEKEFTIDLKKVKLTEPKNGVARKLIQDYYKNK